MRSLFALLVASSTNDPLAEMGWFRDLVGSCWTGTYAGGAISDTQCYDLQYGRFMRGTIEVVQKDRPHSRGDSVFAWNAKEKRIDYWFWADNGHYGSSEAFVEGNAIRFQSKDTRRIWTRIDADSFRVVQEKQEGTAWKAVLTVVYTRVKRR